MVLGVADSPVKRLAFFLPFLFGHAEMLEPHRRRFTEPAAELALAVSDARQNVLENRRIRIFDLVPIDAFVLFLREYLLPKPLLVHHAEVAVQLTVVAPDAHVVNRLDTHEIGFASNVALQIRHKLREPPAAV